MRTIVHLSDLHFGRVDAHVGPALVNAIRAARPDLIAISGDFTQHGRRHEFVEAREFVRALPGRVLAVPGNHDMAFMNPFRRFTERLSMYRRYIAEDTEPSFVDGEIAVCGLNTARVELFRGGRVSRRQVEKLERFMAEAAPGLTRVLVTHHPFDLPERFAARELIGRDVFARVVRVVDLMLAGHMHVAHAGPTAERHKVAGQSAVFVQAGTMSRRLRGEGNSFQLIRVEPGRISVSQHELEESGTKFRCLATTHFHRDVNGWVRSNREMIGEAGGLR
ncbi:MAG: metallophosphoesterase [Bryobacteraceae bacterium]|nr:metallophosphoesterase [Bryobacteraceae bacterium]